MNAQNAQKKERRARMPKIRISKRALEKLEILSEENDYEYVDDFANDLILGKVGDSSRIRVLW